MFTRPVRRVVATCAIVVLTMAPTAYVGFTAWRIGQSWQAREVEADLSRRLGLEVTIGKVEYPRPGVVVYRGVVIRSERARGELVELARAEALKVRTSGAELVIETDGLRARIAAPGRVLEQAAGLLRPNAFVANFERVSLIAPTCDLEVGEAHWLFDSIAATLQNSAQGPSAFASYRLVDASKDLATRCEASVTRDSRKEKTTITLRTMEGPPIPAAALDPFFPLVDRVGEFAQIEGTLAFSLVGGATEWDAAFEGSLGGVDLGRLFESSDPSLRMTGIGRVIFRRAIWANRPGQGFGWLKAAGEFTATTGTIGSGLLRSLASEMRFRLNPKLERPLAGRREVSYQSMGIEFDLAPDGELEIAGALGDEFPAETVLVSSDHITPLAYAPKGLANTRGLVKALFPTPADALIPGTAEAQALQRRLPLPPAAASRGGRLNSN